MKIVMLGIMGAGKGTQAKNLSGYLKVPHISTGEIFRIAVEEKTELGLKAQEIMKKGEYVPDDIVTGIVKQRISRDDVDNGYILDGFPRTINQAEELSKIDDLDHVFYITIPDEEVLRRLMGRRSCEVCNAQYNIHLDESGPTCKKCGGKIIMREDDNEETIKIRLKNYLDQTEPLIDYYRKKNILDEIDGNRSIEEVFNSLKELVSSG